jgi:hypothetical protein
MKEFNLNKEVTKVVKYQKKQMKRSSVMRLKSHIEDWLDDGGHKLGFSMGQLPAMSDMDWILENEIPSDVYFSSRLFRVQTREFIKLTKGVE